MFKRADEDARRPVTIHVEGIAVEAREGDSVSAALLASGLDVRRTTAVSGARRLPYCMMGVCFDCLAEIDGEPNRQSCMVTVRSGMRIRRQRGARSVAAE
jgi:predicted molibdopterin-dependent oxidoreductase YjgC